LLNVNPGAIDFGRLHTRHAIRKVVLVAGTFAGNDPFNITGTLNSLADRLPAGGASVRAMAQRVSLMTQEAFGSLADDVGNFSPEFIQRFQELTGGDPSVERLQPVWSGQNHHYARADLAVRLLAYLDQFEFHRREQILLWGHSHAGSGFALLSNLLANDPASIERFFEVCGPSDAPHWLRAYRSLRSNPSPHPLVKHVTVVTFGAPVRYGWDTDGLRTIYHVLHDRNTQGGGRLTTEPMFPPQSIGDMFGAVHGDWVQAFAIAGTDVVPPAPSVLQRNNRIAELLLRGLQPAEETFDTRLIPVEHLRSLCARWKIGTRCHADGNNLLVEYRPCGRFVGNRPVESSVFGHGVATTIDWLPAHLALILQRMDLTAA